MDDREKKDTKKKTEVLVKLGELCKSFDRSCVVLQKVSKGVRVGGPPLGSRWARSSQRQHQTHLNQESKRVKEKDHRLVWSPSVRESVSERSRSCAQSWPGDPPPRERGFHAKSSPKVTFSIHPVQSNQQKSIKRASIKKFQIKS